MKHLYLILLFGFVQVIKAQNPEQEIRDILNKQLISWNAGDIKGFMFYYWQSDSLQFVTSKGIVKGWENMLSYYQKAYPTKEKMGSLDFDVIDVHILSPESAFLIGRWRVLSNEKTNEGYFSLVFKKIKGDWLIVVDHTS
jgi:uncharacterized protein (TIGR02246 family)